MPYREQQYVERSGARCFCDARATTACRCCGRDRCRAHLRVGLCNRCDQAMDRVRPAIVNAALTMAGAVGVVATVVLLRVLGLPSLLFGFGSAGVTGTLTYVALAQRHRRRLAAKMAATVGELPPVPRETASFPDPPPPPPGFP